MFLELLDFLFPPQCASCGAAGAGLCDRCAPGAETLRRQLSTIEVAALGSYCGAYRRAILALKDGRRDVANALASRLARHVCAGDVLVPVTTTAARRRVRGMDNVAELARLTAQMTGATALAALHRVGRDAQRGRSRDARLAARGRFECDSALVRSRRVVLIDDVCTTGSTLEDCAAVLRAAGACVEEAVVVALA